MKHLKTFIMLSAVAVILFVSSTNVKADISNMQHPYGTNVNYNGTIYYVSSTGLIPYTSAAVFESYGFNLWSNVVPANSADLALPRLQSFMPYADGTLVNDNGTVYAISNGSKYGISGGQIFNELGYSWNSVVKGDTSFVPAGTLLSPGTIQGIHLEGTLINVGGTIYYSTQYGRMAFPSMSVFNSWGFKLSNLVLPNSYDLAATDGSNSIVTAWTLGELSPLQQPSQPYANPTASTPLISSLSISAGPVGTQVTVFGKGFTDNGNSIVTVTGNSWANSLTSSDGTTLSFTIPSSAGAYCPSSLQACPDYAMVVSPNNYSFEVVNTNGSSNEQNFTVLATGTPAFTMPAPTVTGPTNLQVGQIGTYTVSTTDQGVVGYSNDPITYTLNWTDGTSAAISNPLPSGNAFSGSHAWSFPGTYEIQVMASPVLGVIVTSNYRVVVQ